MVSLFECKYGSTVRLLLVNKFCTYFSFLKTADDDRWAFLVDRTFPLKDCTVCQDPCQAEISRAANPVQTLQELKSLISDFLKFQLWCLKIPCSKFDTAAHKATNVNSSISVRLRRGV